MNFQELYDAKVDFSVETCHGAGVNVKLGNMTFGYTARANVATMEEALEWLYERSGLREKDESTYAKTSC